MSLRAFVFWHFGHLKALCGCSRSGICTTVAPASEVIVVVVVVEAVVVAAATVVKEDMCSSCKCSCSKISICCSSNGSIFK